MTTDTNKTDATDANPWLAPPVGRSSSPERLSVGSWFTGLGALALISGGLGYGYYREWQVSSGANSTLETKARAFISATLKDPESAQFRDITIHNTCVEGEVNAKNAFGGYAGFSAFYYDDRLGKGEVAPERTIAAPPGTAAALSQTIEQADFSVGESDCLMGYDMSKLPPHSSLPTR